MNIYDDNIEYYKNCIYNYDKTKNVDTIINRNEITFSKITDFENDIEYIKLIDDIIETLKCTEKKQFIPNISYIYNITENDIHNLLIKIIPFFENIYNSYLKIVDIKLLEHKIGIFNEGAFLWHYDNHPKTIINIIIYLNEVEKNSGGFEYITMNNKIIKQKYIKPQGNKNMESFVKNNNININQVIGKKGTIFFFDNNIIHRAGSSLKKQRLALLIQVYPSLNKIY
jgi:hypothetical protein